MGTDGELRLDEAIYIPVSHVRARCCVNRSIELESSCPKNRLRILDVPNRLDELVLVFFFFNCKRS